MNDNDDPVCSLPGLKQNMDSNELSNFLMYALPENYSKISGVVLPKHLVAGSESVTKEEKLLDGDNFSFSSTTYFGENVVTVRPIFHSTGSNEGSNMIHPLSLNHPNVLKIITFIEERPWMAVVEQFSTTYDGFVGRKNVNELNLKMILARTLGALLFLRDQDALPSVFDKTTVLLANTSRDAYTPKIFVPHPCPNSEENWGKVVNGFKEMCGRAKKAICRPEVMRSEIDKDIENMENGIEGTKEECLKLLAGFEAFGGGELKRFLNVCFPNTGKAAELQ